MAAQETPAELRSDWTGEGARPHTVHAAPSAKAPLESRAFAEVRSPTPDAGVSRRPKTDDRRLP